MYFSAIDATAIPHDFSEALTEDSTTVYWDTYDLELSDDETVTVIDHNGTPWGIVQGEQVFDHSDMRDQADTWECNEHDECETCTPPITRTIIDEVENSEPYMNGSEGPMMNYLWPLNTNGLWHPITPEEAARRLADLPLCVVDIDDCLYLALTGGGMDLSWEIGAAYVALGFAPPVALDFPRMAGDYTTRYAHVIAAQRESIDALQRQLKSKLERLDALQAAQ